MDFEQCDASTRHLVLTEEEIRYFAGLIERVLGRRVFLVLSDDSWPLLDQGSASVN
jgi:hypothetical protein